MAPHQAQELAQKLLILGPRQRRCYGRQCRNGCRDNIGLPSLIQLLGADTTQQSDCSANASSLMRQQLGNTACCADLTLITPVTCKRSQGSTHWNFRWKQQQDPSIADRPNSCSFSKREAPSYLELVASALSGLALHDHLLDQRHRDAHQDADAGARRIA